MKYIIGIETSCDDTAVGFFDILQKKVSLNIVHNQNSAHAEFGGIVPEIAGRKQLQNITLIMNKLKKLSKLNVDEINFFCVTTEPGLIGSLLVGVNFTRTLAWAFDKPVIGINHLDGHIFSPLIENSQLTFPYLCLLISGGNTILCEVKSIYEVNILGKTRDDAVGETFDKVAKMLGLQYPGGPKVEYLAKKWNGSLFNLPVPLKKTKDISFSYSGLKTAVRILAQQEGVLRTEQPLLELSQLEKLDKNKREKIMKICSSFQTAVAESLYIKCKEAIKNSQLKKLSIVGGSACNNFIFNYLKKKLEPEEVQIYRPSLPYCLDNGAMIAYVGYLYFKADKKILEKKSIAVKIANIIK